MSAQETEGDALGRKERNCWLREKKRSVKPPLQWGGDDATALTNKKRCLLKGVPENRGNRGKIRGVGTFSETEAGKRKRNGAFTLKWVVYL